MTNLTKVGESKPSVEMSIAMCSFLKAAQDFSSRMNQGIQDITASIASFDENASTTLSAFKALTEFLEELTSDNEPR
jgi:hypothetical protein